MFNMCPGAATNSIDGPELRTLDCQAAGVICFFTGVLHVENLVGIRGSLETISVG